jgi:hypothetical protein
VHSQENNADNEVYRFENVAHHSPRKLLSALRFQAVTCAEQRHCRASSGSPANLIADPLGTDGEDKHDERSKGDPKDR